MPLPLGASGRALRCTPDKNKKVLNESFESPHQQDDPVRLHKTPGQAEPEDDPMSRSINVQLEEKPMEAFQWVVIALCFLINMLDGCALSLPIHEAGELPSSMMIWQGPMKDDAILNVSLAIESALNT